MKKQTVYVIKKHIGLHAASIICHYLEVGGSFSLDVSKAEQFTDITVAVNAIDTLPNGTYEVDTLYIVS